MHSLGILDFRCYKYNVCARVLVTFTNNYYSIPGILQSPYYLSSVINQLLPGSYYAYDILILLSSSHNKAINVETNTSLHHYRATCVHCMCCLTVSID